MDAELINRVLLKFSPGFEEHRKNLSAVLPTNDKYLWFGSDETSTIERLSPIDENNFADHKQFHVAQFISLPDSEEMEIDIEGLALSDGYMWFTGSHSYKRKRVKDALAPTDNLKRLSKISFEHNRYVIGRIPLAGGELVGKHQGLTAAKLEMTKTGNALTKALAEDPHLGVFVQARIAGKDNGFDIEGLVLRKGRIFLGLRGPVLRGWAVILEIEVEDAGAGLLKLRKIGAGGAKYKKHFLDLKGLGIRDLSLDGEDFLVLAGPTMDLSRPVRVYRLRNAVNLRENDFSKPELVLEIPAGDKKDHAEGIALFEGFAGVRSLITVYDSPAKERLSENVGIYADIFRL